MSVFADQKDTKRRVALYVGIGSKPPHHWSFINEVQYITEDGVESEKVSDDYIRISDVVEITFVESSQQDYLTAAFESLDAKKKSILEKCNKQLSWIESERQELLALPAPERE